MSLKLSGYVTEPLQFFRMLVFSNPETPSTHACLPNCTWVFYRGNCIPEASLVLCTCEIWYRVWTREFILQRRGRRFYRWMIMMYTRRCLLEKHMRLCDYTDVCELFMYFSCRCTPWRRITHGLVSTISTPRYCWIVRKLYGAVCGQGKVSSVHIHIPRGANCRFERVLSGEEPVKNASFGTTIRLWVHIGARSRALKSITKVMSTI